DLNGSCSSRLLRPARYSLEYSDPQDIWGCGSPTRFSNNSGDYSGSRNRRYFRRLYGRTADGDSQRDCRILNQEDSWRGPLSGRTDTQLFQKPVAPLAGQVAA